MNPDVKLSRVELSYGPILQRHTVKEFYPIETASQLILQRTSIMTSNLAPTRSQSLQSFLILSRYTSLSGVLPMFPHGSSAYISLLFCDYQIHGVFINTRTKWNLAVLFWCGCKMRRIFLRWKKQTAFINNRKDSVQLVIQVEFKSVLSRLFAPLSW